MRRLIALCLVLGAAWFLKGRLVVLYIGVHPGLRAWLVSVLGAAFVDGHAT